MKLTTLFLILLLAVSPSVAQVSNNTSNNASADATASHCTDLDGNVEPCPSPAPAIRKTQPDTTSSMSLRNVPYDIIHQQARFWTSPAKLRAHDLNWAFPFALTTTALFIADPTIDKHMAPHTSIVSNSQTFSNASIALIVGSAGGMYLWGHMRQNERMRNTGFMAGEAGLNSFLSTFVMKEIAQRARPEEVTPPGSRGFRQGGSSFPSEHSAAAWSVATVVAHQYPGTGTKLFAYGLAAAISATRVTGRQHFSSDAFLGSAIGWYIGRQVWESHQVKDDTARWGKFEAMPKAAERNPDSYGSPFVPLDSWVYPAFDRLAALGYVQSAFRDMRPWSRMECARLVDEAEPLVSTSESPEAKAIFASLQNEFAPEFGECAGETNNEVVLDSFYTRFEGIAGNPLRDGYHFGQTITDDYGRPYGEGFNNVTGASARATAGPLFAYVRGEYQRAPSAPYVPPSAGALVSIADHGVPLNAYPAFFPAESRFRLLEGYFGLNVGNFQFSFGKQSMWWGPGDSGGMLMSNNAEPITMLHITRARPFKLPSIFGYLGPMKTDFFIGRLSGHEFLASNGIVGTPGVPLDPQPYIHGEKFTFKPTPNFEFSLGRTTLISGPGYLFTSHTYFKSMFSFSTSNTSGVDPGDRRSSFDFSYRVPKLRDWLQVYIDSFTDDQVSPLAYPRNSAVNPGIYIPKLPHLHKMDFRMEGMYTPYDHFPGFFYFNVRYLQGYTNNGQLLANWIGRQGTGVQAWTNYWLSPRSRIQASYRTVRVDRDFLEGGSQQDFSVRADLALRHHLSVSSFVQYETWNFPLLASTRQRNVTASVQLEFRPQWRIK